MSGSTDEPVSESIAGVARHRSAGEANSLGSHWLRASKRAALEKMGAATDPKGLKAALMHRMPSGRSVVCSANWVAKAAPAECPMIHRGDVSSCAMSDVR